MSIKLMPPTRRRSDRCDRIFSKLLVRLMSERGMKIREAANIARVNPSTVMSWRSGSAPLNYSAVKRLAEALGVSLAFLLTGEREEASSSDFASIEDLIEDGEVVFDGYAKVTVCRLLMKPTKKEKV